MGPTNAEPNHNTEPNQSVGYFNSRHQLFRHGFSVPSDDGDISDKKKQINMDMMVIMTALLLQDLPFFCLRMVLIFRYAHAAL